MVQERDKEGIEEFVCEACGFRYQTRKLAEQCEQWCLAHDNTCNIEITAQGLPPETA